MLPGESTLDSGFGIRFIAYMKVRHQFIFCEEACAQIISHTAYAVMHE